MSESPGDRPALLVRVDSPRPGVWDEVERLLESLMSEDRIDGYSIEIEGSGTSIR